MAEGAPRRCGAPRRRARPPALQGQGRAGSSRTSPSSTWRRSPPPRPARVMRALSDRVETLLEAPEGAHHLGQVDGRVIDGGDAPDDLLVLPLTLACETHADLVAGALRQGRRRRAGRLHGAQRRRLDRRRVRLRAAQRARRAADRADRDLRRRRHRAAPARADRASRRAPRPRSGSSTCPARPTPRRC